MTRRTYPLANRGVATLLCLAVGAAFAQGAWAQSQTAQSVMVQTNLDSTAYEIEGTITWTYNRDGAETYYTNALTSGPVITMGNGAQPDTPAPPAPRGVNLLQHAQAERCTFFNGGNLTSDSYEQTVNEARGWKFTWTYNITPKVASVAPKTEWSFELTGTGAVDIGFDGFIAGESYLKQANGRTKYSFTLSNPDLTSRVQDVTAVLEKFDGTNWIGAMDPILIGTVPYTATTTDYSYYGNAGEFGNNAVRGQLHAPGRKPATMVSAILLEDNFANNNNDLASGNVHQADFMGSFAGVSEGGDYRVRMTGTVKGNAGVASAPFSVTSTTTVIGGCAAP